MYRGAFLGGSELLAGRVLSLQLQEFSDKMKERLPAVRRSLELLMSTPVPPRPSAGAGAGAGAGRKGDLEEDTGDIGVSAEEVPTSASVVVWLSAEGVTCLRCPCVLSRLCEPGLWWCPPPPPLLAPSCCGREYVKSLPSPPSLLLSPTFCVVV
jgi:hypothetical protein